MKKVVSVVLALAVVLAMTACGSKEEVNKNGHVADKYYKMMDGDDPEYYYEADVEEQFLDEEGSAEGDAAEVTKSVMGEGRDGKDKFVLLEGESEFESRQIETGKESFSVQDSDKEYTKEELEPEEDMDLAYVKTDKLELDGKTYQYDEYQASYEMPSESDDEDAMDTYLYIKRFLVDDQGELKALVYRQEMKGEDGKENQPIYQRVERITELTAKASKDLFEVPKDYKEVQDLDDEAMYDDEELSDEAVSEEE